MINLSTAYTQLHQAIQNGKIGSEYSELSKILQQNPIELFKESELLDKIKALNIDSFSSQVDRIRSVQLKQALTEEVDDVRNLLDTSSITRPEIKGEFIAHWINIHFETKNWSSLKIENLSKEELTAAAPHLLYVHPKCTVNLDDLEMKLFLDICKNATHLILSGNQKVTKLVCNHKYHLKTATLLNNPQLKEINFSYTDLKELVADAPNIEKLELTNCRELSTMKVSLSKCRHFDYRGSPKLKGPVDLPLTAWLGSGEELILDLKKLADNPVEVLLALGNSYSINYRCLPNIVWSKKMDRGFDRLLIPTLCKHLFKKRISFPTVERMPVLKIGDKNSVLAIQTFGKLIGFCATTTTLMGSYLPSRFFNAVFALTNDDTIESNKPLSDTLNKKLYCALNDIEDGEEFGEQDTVAIKTLAEALHACAIIAKELKNFIEDFDSWRTEPLAFSRLVQGRPVTEEALRHQLTYRSDASRIEEKHVAEMKEYFEDFIERHPDKHSDLVEFLTGNFTLGYDKLKIMVQAEGGSFGVSWGNPEIEIPYFSSYSEFEEALLKRLNSN